MLTQEETESKVYNLEERTFQFAKNIRAFLKKLPKSISNFEDSKQLARSSGTIGANYIEANESLGKKDFAMRLKISRKEAKESGLWLRLLDTTSDPRLESERELLYKESVELLKIFTSIINKCV